MIGTQPNYHSEIITESEHCFDLPRMCPVSGNPQPGSVLTVRYVARESLDEVWTQARKVTAASMQIRAEIAATKAQKLAKKAKATPRTPAPAGQPTYAQVAMEL